MLCIRNPTVSETRALIIVAVSNWLPRTGVAPATLDEMTGVSKPRQYGDTSLKVWHGPQLSAIQSTIISLEKLGSEERCAGG